MGDMDSFRGMYLEVGGRESKSSQNHANLAVEKSDEMLYFFPARP